MNNEFYLFGSWWGSFCAVVAILPSRLAPWVASPSALSTLSGKSSTHQKEWVKERAHRSVDGITESFKVYFFIGGKLLCNKIITCQKVKSISCKTHLLLTCKQDKLLVLNVCTAGRLPFSGSRIKTWPSQLL